MESSSDNQNKNIPDSSTKSLPELRSQKTEIKTVPQDTGTTTATTVPGNQDPTTARSILYTLQDYALALILILLACLQYLFQLIVQIVESVIVYGRKAGHVIRFAWNKPEHFKEIVRTTLHLIRVTYDAGLWDWTEMYGIVCQQISPMAKTPSPGQQTPPTRTPTTPTARTAAKTK